MGMDLSSTHILLTEEQYADLKANKLFFKSCWDLELIDEYKAEDERKIALFDALEEALHGDIIELPVGTNLEEYIKDELYDEIDKEYYPVSLEEFLNYDYDGDWIINNVYEEKIGEQTFYLIVQLRYW